MRLSQILSAAPEHQLAGEPSILIRHITQDSRQVQPGTAFFAIRGQKSDGHDFLVDVCIKGASVLVVENTSKVPEKFKGVLIVTKDTRKFFEFISSAWFEHPSRSLLAVGVTGTNGKTTTTHMVEKIFSDRGRPTGVIGTIDHHLGTKIWPTSLTTPDSFTLHSRLREFVSLGARGLAIEVSSHALSQCRGDAIDFDIGVFTNLTRDHLDYHASMDEYFLAKTKIFSDLMVRSVKRPKTAVVNSDDPYGRKLIAELPKDIRSLSFGESGFLRHQVLKEDFSGSHIKVDFESQKVEFLLPLPCRYNVYNAMAAMGAALGAQIPLSKSAEALSDFKGVKGRVERVLNSKGLHIFVDYAHSDDALSNVLGSFQKLKAQSKSSARIITVFGCGGDRDRGKRPLMAKAAISGSDFVVVTSDNPRTEDPQAILNDIAQGIPMDQLGKSVFMQVQRKEGIQQALNLAKKGDVVLIAGKGHEDYQIIGTQKFPFSDVSVVKELIGE